MIKMLHSTFANVPVVGPALKAAYVGSLVKELVQKGKDSPAKGELLNMGGNELDAALNDQAHAMYDENITPIVKENNIPDGIHDPIKNKAINELVGVLRTQVQKHKDKIPGVK